MTPSPASIANPPANPSIANAVVSAKPLPLDCPVSEGAITGLEAGQIGPSANIRIRPVMFCVLPSLEAKTVLAAMQRQPLPLHHGQRV